MRITDLARAQALADTFNPEHLHHRLRRYAHWLCPVADVFAQDDWHWSIRQAEYCTDLMFRSRDIVRQHARQFTERAQARQVVEPRRRRIRVDPPAFATPSPPPPPSASR